MSNQMVLEDFIVVVIEDKYELTVDLNDIIRADNSTTYDSEESVINDLKSANSLKEQMQIMSELLIDELVANHGMDLIIKEDDNFQSVCWFEYNNQQIGDVMDYDSELNPFAYLNIEFSEETIENFLKKNYSLQNKLAP